MNLLTSTLVLLSVGVAGVAMRAFAWNIPPLWLPLSTAVRAFIAILLPTACAARNVQHYISAAIVLPFTLALGLAWGAFLAMRRRFERGIAALMLAMRNHERRIPAVVRISDLAQRAFGRPNAAAIVLQASGALASAGEYDKALRLLDAVDVPVALGANHAQARATCLLRLDRTEEAKATLDAIALAADSPFLPWFDALRALVDAVEGGADKALVSVARLWPQAPKILRDSLRVVRAHAYACRGEEGHARQELDILLAENGVVGLLGVVQPVGPATDLARAMLAERMQDAQS